MVPEPAAHDPGRPVLTFPEEVAAEVRAAYSRARVILEYGAGGSTAMGAELKDRLVFTVESDPDWIARLDIWLTTHPAQADLRLHRADIGEVKRWGYPAANRAFRKWPDYALSVWDRPDFVQPDTILIDGRFRVACFLTALVRSTAPVTLLWDDYADRPHYHAVEQVLRPAATHGRMARFDLVPMPLPPAALRLLAESYMDPR